MEIKTVSRDSAFVKWRSPVGAGDDCFVMPDLIGHLNLKFVLHVADDLAVEEVDDSLCACCILL